MEIHLTGQPAFSGNDLNHNIPVDLTRFIGRENEVQQVKNIMRATRLLTLTGVGGTGKTRLALQAARSMLDDFMDGVWVVELSTIFECKSGCPGNHECIEYSRSA